TVNLNATLLACARVNQIEVSGVRLGCRRRHGRCGLRSRNVRRFRWLLSLICGAGITNCFQAPHAGRFWLELCGRRLLNADNANNGATGPELYLRSDPYFDGRRDLLSIYKSAET